MLGPLNLFVGTLSLSPPDPNDKIYIHIYIYDNQYQLFVFSRHVQGSLYLQPFNQRFQLSRLGWPFCYVTGTCMSNKEVNLYKKFCFLAIVQLKQKTSVCESIKGNLESFVLQSLLYLCFRLLAVSSIESCKLPPRIKIWTVNNFFYSAFLMMQLSMNLIELTKILSGESKFHTRLKMCKQCVLASGYMKHCVKVW